MTKPSIVRRELLTGIAAGAGAVLLASKASAQAAPAAKPAQPPAAKRPAPPAAPAPASPALQAIIDSTAVCLRESRVCLARCTDHLAAGMKNMAECQRSVMNVLAVTGAMADVAGYRNADAAAMKALAAACAQFCRACAKACEPHAAKHEECKACLQACLDCAKACEAFSA